MSVGLGSTADEVGYLHPAYAHSLSEFGQPRHLPASGGWILERGIPNSDCKDAMGCYPLFTCRDWSTLCQDLAALDPRLVSLTIVTDPFAEDKVDTIRDCFDEVAQFKTHHVANLGLPSSKRTSQRHRTYARAVLRDGLTVERAAEPLRFLDEWIRLYAFLSERHHLAGIKRFTRRAFSEQLSVPGVIMFRAIDGEKAVAAHIWYVHGDIAYSHLQAADESGYAKRAAYALYAVALDQLAQHCSYADLGASAGLADDPEDGLAQFKRGWATERRTAYLCKRVFDQDVYLDLKSATGATDTTYFPAYRAGELI